MGRPMASPKKIRDIVRMHWAGGSGRQISKDIGLARTSVQRYIKFIKEQGITWESVQKLDEQQLIALFGDFSSKKDVESERYSPVPCEMIWQQIETQSGFTRQDAFEQYRINVKGTRFKAYGRTTFFQKLADYWQSTHPDKPLPDTIVWIPGQCCQIDYCGDTLPLYSAADTTVSKVHFFVGVFPHSGFVFAHATLDEKRESWMEGIQKMLEKAQGVPKIIIVDNAKALVDKPGKYNPRISGSLQSMANHYGFIVEAAFPHCPRHKGAVEAAVKQVQNKIIAPLLKHKFFSLESIRTVLSTELDKFNSRPRQYDRLCRSKEFELERSHLQRLPTTAYQVDAKYEDRVATPSAFLSIKGHKYSVPENYAGKKVSFFVDKANQLKILDYETRRIIAEHTYHSDNNSEVKVHLDPTHRSRPSIEDTRTVEKGLEQLAELNPEVLLFARTLLADNPKVRTTQKARWVWGIREYVLLYGESMVVEVCQKLQMTNHPTFSEFEDLLGPKDNDQTTGQQKPKHASRSEDEFKSIIYEKWGKSNGNRTLQ